MEPIQNKVLTGDATKSKNFFESDVILRHYLQSHVTDEGRSYMENKWNRMGRDAARFMDELSIKADLHPPELKERTPLGEDKNEIEFHPSYWELMEMAVRSEMFFVKYDDALKARFKGVRHMLGFTSGLLYAMSELGQYCPLCMTDGAALLLERHGEQDDIDRLLPRLGCKAASDLYTGAMFITEKSGGSDVGRNIVRAEQIENKYYRLQGEKWFCSNANADVILALARTGEESDGTRGLSLFLIEKTLPEGESNPIKFVRLKDKLGVRSMATAEVVFENTVGKRIGNTGEGFKIMTDMINMSRLYNSVGALAAARRAMIESWQYLNHRVIFGKRAVEHALIRQKFHELGSLHLANFLLVMRTIRAMDAAESGDEREQQVLRILIPMAKWWSAETAIYMVRESMELMGGNGYIEDFVLPKIFRDVNVLPIWEGSGNVIVLDILRAIRKSDGMQFLLEDIKKGIEDHSPTGNLIRTKLIESEKLLDEISGKDRDTVEATAKPLFRRIIHLYQMYLMNRETDKKSKEWTDPALQYLSSILNDDLSIQSPLNVNQITKLVGWNYK